MNKQDLIDAVAIKTGSSKVAASEALVAVLDTIKETLAKGDKVSLIGFGTFETSKRAARTGRNPQTGAPLKIAAATVPKFSAGKGLKDAVNVQPKAAPKAKAKAKK